MGRLTSLLLAVALLVGTPIAIAGEQGVTLFDVELKATPDAEASTVGKVPKNTQVEIIERRGAWSRVRALSKGQGEGWVSTYDVRLSGEAAQREQSGETGLGRFLGMLFGEPTQHGPQVTSTIGIRGMDAADLAAAKPDPEDIWPFMGIFIHSVDAETGEILWTNSGDGTNYTVQPHGAPSFAAVVPQGHLAISGDHL
ncbi:MAG: SH3 domain-containing protein, partial [Gammaproteobacteria bacterium]